MPISLLDLILNLTYTFYVISRKRERKVYSLKPRHCCGIMLPGVTG